jgi:hypothetical protein
MSKKSFCIFITFIFFTGILFNTSPNYKTNFLSLKTQNFVHTYINNLILHFDSSTDHFDIDEEEERLFEVKLKLNYFLHKTLKLVETQNFLNFFFQKSLTISFQSFTEITLQTLFDLPPPLI